MNAPDQLVNSEGAGLGRYAILDTPPEPAFDDLARRAAEALGTTMAAISFFERGDSVAGGSDVNDRAATSSITREWFKARIGLTFPALAPGQCFYLPAFTATPRTPAVFVIPDTLADKRFRDHPFVAGPPFICFYAASGIFSPAGQLLGVLSVFDTVSREVLARELEALKNLAELARARMEARVEARRERHSNLDVPTINGTAATSAEQRVVHLTQQFQQLEQTLEDEIASRKVAEATIRYEKDFSDAAIQSLPRAFFMFEQSGKMVRWNEQFAQSTGHTMIDLQHMHALDFIAEADRPLMADAIRRIFESGDAIGIEARMRRKDGATFPYSLYGRAADLDGKRYCIGVGRDVTDQKRAEREVARAKERLDLALVGSGLAIWDWDLVNNQAPWFLPPAKAREFAYMGDSISGKEMAHLGWANYAVPKDQLDDFTIRFARRMAHIDNEMLMYSKRAVNRQYEAMGMRQALASGTEIQALSALRKAAGEWGRHVREDGLKAALEWRDGPFRDFRGAYASAPHERSPAGMEAAPVPGADQPKP